MRRSTRIRWEIPVLITSLAPGVEFSECCDTVAVNAHGCGIITTTRLEKGIPVKLSLLPNSQEATAHIADVVPLGEDGKSWLLGIQLNEPRNVWGVTSPPEDWNLGAPAADPALTTLSASATVDSSLPSELGLLETAARAAAVGAGAASPTATSPLQSAAPLNRRKSPGQSPSVGVIEPQFSEESLATLENSSGDRLDPLDLFEAKLRDRAKSVLQEFEKDSRRRAAAASADAPRMRERDWGHIREEVEDHLKDVIWQFDGKVDNKLETWRQEMADTETKLSHLQADVESQLKELRELIRDNTPQPDEIEKWGLELPQPISERPGTSLESASAGLDPAALEHVRELQEWKESLVAQLPHIVEQQVNLAGGNDKRLQSESQEVLSRIQAELQDLKLRLEQLDAAQQLAHSAARADFATAEQAMQTALQDRSNELYGSLQERLTSTVDLHIKEIETAKAGASGEVAQLQARAGELARQVEEISQARTWIESLVKSLPQTVQHHTEQHAAAVQERLQGSCEEIAARLHSELAKSHATLSEAATQAEQKIIAAEERLHSEIVQRSKHFEEITQRAPELVQQAMERCAAEVEGRLHHSSQESLAKLESQIAASKTQFEDLAVQTEKNISSAEQGLRSQLDQRKSELEKIARMLPQIVQQQVEQRATVVQGRLITSSEDLVNKLQRQLAATKTQFVELTSAAERQIASAQQRWGAELEQHKVELAQAKKTVQAEVTQLQTRAAELANDAKEISKARAWMESVAQTLPQSVQQQIEQIAAAKEEKLRSSSDDLLAALQNHLLTSQKKVEDVAAAAQQQIVSQSDARSQELRQQTDAMREEHARLVEQLRQEAAARLAQLTQVRDTISNLQAPEQLDARIAQLLNPRLESLQSSVHQEIAKLQSKFTTVEQNIEELLSRPEGPAAGLLTTDVERAAQAMLQQSGEEWCSSLRKRVQSEFEQQKEELARFAADAKAQADRFDGQAIKLSAQLEEASHARESLQSMVGSLVEAANQRLQEVATTSLLHLRNRSEAEAARMSDQAGQHRAYMQELLQQNQTISQSIDLSAQQLKDTTATEMRGLSEQLCNTMRERLQTEFDRQAQRLSQATADAKSETARLEGQTSQLLERWKTIVEAHIQTAIDEVLAHTQQRLERLSSSAVEQQLARVQQQIEHSLDPLLARAHSATSGLETVLASIESERQQAEHARSDAQQQFGKAQTWLTEETARFRESVHDALLEASGEIKGRIHMAVEMTKEPIERRGRDVQLQIEEMAARKSREFAQHFVEIEKALEPLLQQRLAQSLEQFREGSQELAQTSMNQYQKELDETLDSMLRLLRSKPSPSS